MKRLSFALILAISIHAVFFSIKIGTSRVPEILPESEPIKIKMAFRKKVKPQKVQPRKKQLQKIEQNQKSQKKIVEQLKVKEKQPESNFKKKLKPVTTKKEVPEKKIKSVLVEKRVKKPQQKIEPEPEIKSQFKQDQKLEEPILVSKKLIDPDQKRESEPTADESNAERPPLFPGKIQPVDAAVHTKATPKYKTNPKPLYPRIAKRRGYHGTVVLQVVVSKSGTVKKLSVSKSSRYEILDKAACKAVEKWCFYPGTRDGEPVEMNLTIPIRFDLPQ